MNTAQVVALFLLLLTGCSPAVGDLDIAATGDTGDGSNGEPVAEYAHAVRECNDALATDRDPPRDPEPEREPELEPDREPELAPGVYVLDSEGDNIGRLHWPELGDIPDHHDAFNGLGFDHMYLTTPGGFLFSLYEGETDAIEVNGMKRIYDDGPIAWSSGSCDGQAYLQADFESEQVSEFECNAQGLADSYWTQQCAAGERYLVEQVNGGGVFWELDAGELAPEWSVSGSATIAGECVPGALPIGSLVGCLVPVTPFTMPRFREGPLALVVVQ